MEDKVAWRRVHTELVENHRVTQDMSATLAKARTCCAELLSCFTTDGNGIAFTGVEDKAKDDVSVKGELLPPQESEVSGLRNNYWTDYHKTWWKVWLRREHIQFECRSRNLVSLSLQHFPQNSFNLWWWGGEMSHQRF